MPRGAVLAIAVAILAAAADTKAARADGEAPPGEARPADGLTLDVVGACPDAGEVRRLLTGLVSPAEARAAPVSVQDRGPNFRVAVRESAVMLADPARDCAARARLAAAVAASDLQGRRIVYGPPVWTIEKGFVLEAASPRGPAVWAPGAEIRGAWGSKPWSLFGAAGARGPVTLQLDRGLKAEVIRAPVDVGARITSYRWRLRPWAAVGGSLTLSGILGEELVQTDRVWRLDIGPMAMAGATLRVTEHLGVAAALSVRWQPRPYRLQAVPFGTVGETPAWWFALSLNYTIDGKGSTPP
jgi:hypothetical protein